ncbi:MAG: c-type cytochrome domain-containing protein [Verrucomicrobiota bacterium]
MLSRLLRPRSQKIAAILLFALFAAALTAAFVKFPQGAPLPPFLNLSGKFHPLILHLPIGMLVGAVLLECVTGPLRRHDAAVTLLLWLGFVSSMKAVLAGYFLAQPGGYPQDVLQWHLWSGISVPVLTFITLLAKLHHQQKSPLMSSSLYRVPLFTTAAALFVAGHFGGTMSHGDILKDIKTFVKTPAAAPVVTAGSPLTDLVIYDAVIAPMMESKCVSCHGLEKQKGELQLHTHEAMIKAGESEKLAIIPGKSAQSESVLRILLPASHDDHMPPENKPQITAAELEVLQWWVDAGASPDLKVGDASVPDNVREKISALLAAPAITGGAQGEDGAAGPAGAPAAAPDMAPVQALEKELGVAILPLAQNDPALSFNCVNVADKFGDAELAKFAPVADRMSEVNLGRSKVTDAGLASLAGMKNLKKLHLPNTAVTDAGIDSLLVLTNLEYLNLFNTKITDAGLAKLEKLPNLKRLFVWQTGATKPAAEALHAKLPGLVINLGWDQEVKTVVAAAAAAPAAPTAPAAPAAADPEKAIYETLIHPIFAAKCIGCHGEEKSKGKLKMHTFADLMKNGDSGEATVVAGKAGDSLIIKRALLPLEEDEHMPPSNKDQLSEKELAILKWWIDAGAKTDVKLKDAALPDNLK